MVFPITLNILKGGVRIKFKLYAYMKWVYQFKDIQAELDPT